LIKRLILIIFIVHLLLFFAGFYGFRPRTNEITIPESVEIKIEEENFGYNAGKQGKSLKATQAPAR
jgi:hypothetical protein